MNKKVIIFMPSIEGGGVEKNLFLISNFLSNQFNDVGLITASYEFKNKFKTLELITPYFNLTKFGRKIKYRRGAAEYSANHHALLSCS